MNGYDLSRAWFNFAFENPHKIKPFHGIIFFFAIEHCNRMGWKKIFGFPTSMALDATGIKSYSSYKKHFDELVEFGFIKVHEYSKNQYSSNIIELSFNVKADVKARGKALDKATIKHTSKQRESRRQSTKSIDKPVNQVTNKPINQEEIHPLQKYILDELPNVKKIGTISKNECEKLLSKYSSQEIKETLDSLDNYKPASKKYTSIYKTLDNWIKRDKKEKEKKVAPKKEKLNATQRVMQEHYVDFTKMLTEELSPEKLKIVNE